MDKNESAARLAQDQLRWREDIQQWLVTRIAESLQLDPMELDPREPFASFGMSSVAAVSLSADLEDWLEIRLEPTLTWDYPTIDSLALHLSDKLRRRSVNAPTGQPTITQEGTEPWNR